MNTYTTKDGATFRAPDHATFLVLLRKDSWDPRDSDLEFREATARATEIQTGHAARADTPEHLVEDLIKAGLVWVEGE